MVAKCALRDDQWIRIKDSLPRKLNDPGRSGDNRRFVEGVIWIAKNGAKGGKKIRH